MDSSRYALDNTASHADLRFASLEALYDPVTFRNLAATGVADNWRCWEIGTGSGSVARWLAERVGDAGRVLATDINLTRFGADLSNIETRHHDVVTDPLPEERFDLIHARLVLIHLPERAEIIRRLVAVLRPGGWLAIDDFDLHIAPNLTDGHTPDEQLINRIAAAFGELLDSGGNDSRLGRKLFGLLRGAGLADVHAEGHVAISPGGSAGARLHQSNLRQTRDRLINAGIATAEELERFDHLLEDPDIALTMPVLVASRGRRP